VAAAVAATVIPAVVMEVAVTKGPRGITVTVHLILFGLWPALLRGKVTAG
jgi:hypothetical protein